MKRWIIMIVCALALLIAAPAVSAEAPEEIEFQYPQRFASAQAEYSVHLEDYVDLLELREYLSAQLASCPESVDISRFEIPNSGELTSQLTDFVFYQLPESFHVASVGVSGYGSDYVTTVYPYYRENMDTAEEYAYYHNQFLQAANYLLEGVENNNVLTDVEKALILHDRLANWTAYNYRDYLDNALTDDDFNAYGILAKQTGVCQGYAMAYMYLLGRVDIYSDYVSSAALNHGWNMVYIDGIPYHVDVTWDDPVWDQTGYVGHNNFLRSTEGIIATGHDGGDFTTLPTDTTYDSYYWQNVSTAFQLLGNDIYYIDLYNDTIERAQGTESTTVFQLIWSEEQYWYNFCNLGATQDRLLYNTDKAIWSLDPLTGTKTVIFEPDLSSREGLAIYGFKYEKNYLICNVETDYNYDEETEEDFIRQYYIPSAGEFKVIFKNWDGTVLSTMYYQYGETVQIPPLPTRPNDDHYTYTFIGWDKQIVRVTEDAVYTAVYTASYKEGWYTENGNRYYYENGQKVTNDWRWDGNYCCYLLEDGTPAKEQWIEYDNGWYYTDANGYRLEECWLHLDGKTYYLDGDGRRVTGGSFPINGKLYYFGKDGALLERYTVTFLDWNGTILRSEEYSEGDTVWAPPAPYRAADNTYTYTFAGWDKPITTVTGNATYTATYTKQYIEYEVSFYQDDGTWLTTQRYHYGDAVKLPTDPVKPSDGLYKYQFSHWTPDVRTVNGHADYTAVYTRIPIKNGWYFEDGKYYYYENDRKVKNAWRENESSWCQGDDALCWLGDDGAMFEEQWLTLNGKTYYCGSGGYRVKGEKIIDGKRYCFGSDGVLLPLYLVTFVDWDGTILKQGQYYEGEEFLVLLTPSRPSDGEYHYTFAGWDKEITPVTGDAIYTATYTATEIEKPVLNGWIKENGKWYYYQDNAKVTNKWMQDSTGWCYLGADGAMVTNAWAKDGSGWCWLDASGYMVYSQWVEDGGNKYYVNAGGYRVTGEHTIDGESCYFDENGVYKVRYTVTFKNDNGTVLNTKLYFEGETVQIPADPTKAADANYTYTFAGWDKTVTKVTGDATYTATYTKTEKPNIDTSKNGWIKEDGKWYYYQAGVTVKNVWKKDSKGWCHLGADGAMDTETFVKDSQGCCWVDASGYMVYNRWVKCDGKWYYVDANGYRVHNAWKKDSRGWCYVGADGAMLTNAFVKDSSGWCWVDGSGYIVYSQWVTDNGNKYYINAAGYRVTGEHTIDGESYYFDANGVMEIRYTVIFKNADGTVLSSKKYAAGATVQVPANPTKSPDANYTYTFAGWDKEIEVVTGDATYTATYTKTERPAGSQHGWIKENGKWYYYEQGVMVTNKWKKDSKGWCYLGADGAMVTNRWIKDSVGWCYVGGDGYCLTNSWVKDSTGWCYLDQNGRMAYNRWVGSGNTWYYIDGNGYMLENTSKVIDGKRYYFNASGLCTNP